MSFLYLGHIDKQTDKLGILMASTESELYLNLVVVSPLMIMLYIVLVENHVIVVSLIIPNVVV